MSVFHRIVVPVDFNASSRKALDLAVELARMHDAQLTVMHTIKLPVYAYMNQEFPALDLLTPIHDAASAELDRMISDVRQRHPSARAELRRGTPVAGVLRM